MTTGWDKCIIALFLMLALCFFVCFSFMPEDEDRILNIYSDGKLYASYNLESINKAIETKVENKRGSCIVYISGEKCFITDADCKDRLCEKQFPISGVNQTVTCLPNRILLEIVSGRSENKVDMVAF